MRPSADSSDFTPSASSAYTSAESVPVTRDVLAPADVPVPAIVRLLLRWVLT